MRRSGEISRTAHHSKAVARLSAVVSIVLSILGLLALSEFHKDRVPAAQAATNIDLGKTVYLRNCAACHGENGNGNGPEAHRLKTKPRDFTTGIYKFRSTRSGSLPTDQDIFRTISQGVRTTSMLAQLHLSQDERWAVTEYLKTLSERFETEKPSPSIPIPEPPAARDLISSGKTLYVAAGCSECHGTGGRGDGRSAKELKDEAGHAIEPTDLTVRPFKSGTKPQDLYRTISTGLNGTPMPSYGDVLSEKERWALVYYILSIATRERPRGMMGLIGEEVQGMSIDMQAAMAGMMGGTGMMDRGGAGMMGRGMGEMMKDMMRR
jgi:cytochrome c oxidase cbb3-type subunit I/II